MFLPYMLEEGWFQSLDEYEGDKILLRNNYECKVIGMRTLNRNGHFNYVFWYL